MSSDECGWGWDGVGSWFGGGELDEGDVTKRHVEV